MMKLARTKARQWAKRLLMRVGAEQSEANLMTLSVALTEAAEGEYPTFDPTPEEKIAAMLTERLAHEPRRTIPHHLFLATQSHVPREHWPYLEKACIAAVVAHNEKVK